MISTIVKLETGETVTAYYLDETTKKNLETLLTLQSQSVTQDQLHYQSKRIDELSKEIRETIYYPQTQKALVDLLRKGDLTAQQIRKAIMPNAKKSYLAWRSFWEVWELWTENQVLTRVSVGKNKPGVWHLSIDPEEAKQP